MMSKSCLDSDLMIKWNCSFEARDAGHSPVPAGEMHKLETNSDLVHFKVKTLDDYSEHSEHQIQKDHLALELKKERDLLNEEVRQSFDSLWRAEF